MCFPNVIWSNVNLMCNVSTMSASRANGWFLQAKKNQFMGIQKKTFLIVHVGSFIYIDKAILESKLVKPDKNFVASTYKTKYVIFIHRESVSYFNFTSTIRIWPLMVWNLASMCDCNLWNVMFNMDAQISLKRRDT